MFTRLDEFAASEVYLESITVSVREGGGPQHSPIPYLGPGVALGQTCSVGSGRHKRNKVTFVPGDNLTAHSCSILALSRVNMSMYPRYKDLIRDTRTAAETIFWP